MTSSTTAAMHWALVFSRRRVLAVMAAGAPLRARHSVEMAWLQVPSPLLLSYSHGYRISLLPGPHTHNVLMTNVLAGVLNVRSRHAANASIKTQLSSRDRTYRLGSTWKARSALAPHPVLVTTSQGDIFRSPSHRHHSSIVLAVAVGTGPGQLCSRTTHDK